MSATEESPNVFPQKMMQVEKFTQSAIICKYFIDIAQDYFEILSTLSN